MKKIKSTLPHSSTKISLFGDKSIFKHSKNTLSKVELQIIHCQSVQKCEHSSTYKKIMEKPYYTNSKTSRIHQTTNKNCKQNMNKKSAIHQKKNSQFLQNQKSKRTSINLSSNKIFHYGSDNNILIQHNDNKMIELQQNKKIIIQQLCFNDLTQFKSEQQKNNTIMTKDIVNDIINNIFDKNILMLKQKSLQNKKLNQQIIDTKLILQQNKKNYHQALQSKDQELQKIKKEYEQSKQNFLISISAKDNKIQQLEKNLQNIKTKISQSSQQNKNLQIQFQKSKTQNILLEKQNQTFKKQMVNIRKEIAVLKKQNSIFKKNFQQTEIIRIEKQNESKQNLEKLQKYINLSNSLQYQLEKCKNELSKSQTQKILQLNNLLTSLRQQNFNLLKTIQFLEIRINFIEKKHSDQMQRFKQSIFKQNKSIKEKNKQLIKNNMLLKKILEKEQNKFDSIEFFLEDKPEEL